MSSLPKYVEIIEEGPREGFQIEKGPIGTDRKIELIDALSKTGVKNIVVVSFVNPKRVPGMADAEDVVARITKQPGVSYNAICLNARGVERAFATGRLELSSPIILFTSEPFVQRNQNVTFAQSIEEETRKVRVCKDHGIPVDTASIGAAFGCNFKGEVTVADTLSVIRSALEIAAQNGIRLNTVNLADTMAWATPLSIKRTVGAVQDAFPELRIGLHLHDTRGQAIANAYAGLEMGVDRFDASVAGLGGCPFAGHRGAAGNVCTEDLVFMCHEIGIETGIDLEQLINCARLAEDIVGHPLPGSVMQGGSLDGIRAKLKAAA